MKHLLRISDNPRPPGARTEWGSPMKSSKFVGRVGGLAVGLGIGSAMAAMPWVAYADPTTDAVSSIDLGGLALPGAADSASSFDFSNMSLSIDGMTVFHDGTATATSGSGDFAFADGAGSIANATGGTGNTAIAEGAGAGSTADGGTGDYASATGDDSFANANGTSDYASANGYDSEANTFIDSNTTVIANGAGSSVVIDSDKDLGIADGTNATAGAEGSNDIAAVFGNDSSANVIEGSNDIAAVSGSNSSASVLDGSTDVAAVSGDGSTAGAGFGTGDLAAVFGDGQSAYAELASGATTITPSALAEFFDPSLATGSVDATLLTEFLGLL
jgi:hypothetical protein